MPDVSLNEADVVLNEVHLQVIGPHNIARCINANNIEHILQVVKQDVRILV